MHLFLFIAGFIFSLLLLVTPPALAQTRTCSVGNPIINQPFGTGTYTDVYKSDSGCDSTRILHLTVKNK